MTPNNEHMSHIGQLGGQKTSEKYGAAFYVEIGRLGGKKVSEDRARMAEIGRLGAERRWAKHKKQSAEVLNNKDFEPSVTAPSYLPEAAKRRWEKNQGIAHAKTRHGAVNETSPAES